MPKKSNNMPHANAPGIMLSQQNIFIFETFLQYGDLANARIMFLGLEEGFGRNPDSIVINARRSLASNPLFASSRKFVNGINMNDGWYICDKNGIISLTIAEQLAAKFHNSEAASGGTFASITYVGNNVKSQDLTMTILQRLHWLLQNDHRGGNYNNITGIKFSKYNGFLECGNNCHMIDFYPLPKKGKSKFPYIIPYMWPYNDLNSYYKYYSSNNTLRRKILTNVFNSSPVETIICYAGKGKGESTWNTMKAFFQPMGFSFMLHNTGVVNPAFANIPGGIQKSPRPKDFLIGNRKRNDGLTQKVLLLPFLGNGQVSYKDVDVFSTWV